MTLYESKLNNSYTIKEIEIDDEELISFLFSLGFYDGEKITLLSKSNNDCIVVVKDSRYHIDKKLSKSIII